jgi:hypothetical protein
MRPCYKRKSGRINIGCMFSFFHCFFLGGMGDLIERNREFNDLTE